MADYLELEFGTSGKRERFCGTQNVQLAPNFGSGPVRVFIYSLKSIFFGIFKSTPLDISEAADSDKRGE